MFWNNKADTTRNEELDLQRESLNLNREQGMVDQTRDDQQFYQQQQQHSELIRWQQDMDLALELMEHQLKQEINMGTPEEPKWKTPKGLKPLLNDLGINKIRSMLQPYSSVNLMMSNYDLNQLYCSLRGIIIDIICDISYNYKNYGVDKGDLTSTLRIVKGYLEPTHFRCLNNGERRYLNTINRRVETLSNGMPDQNPKKFGLF